MNKIFAVKIMNMTFMISANCEFTSNVTTLKVTVSAVSKSSGVTNHSGVRA